MSSGTTRWRAWGRGLKSTLLTGLFIVGPFSATFLLLAWIVSLIDAAVAPLVSIFGRPIPGLGIIVALLLIWVAGLVGNNIVGQHALELFEQLLLKIPVFNWLYRTIKQVSEVFSPGSKANFKGVVLVEFPRPGVYSIGFVTNTVDFERAGRRDKLVSVYVPSNHMYIGDIVLVPAEHVVMTKLTQQQGIQSVISAGAALPPTVRAQEPPQK